MARKSLINWTDAREDFYFIQDALITVLSEMNVMSEDAARVWCEKSGETYSISIEKFADLVRKYCEKKSNNHQYLEFISTNCNNIINKDDFFLKISKT